MEIWDCTHSDGSTKQGQSQSLGLREYAERGGGGGAEEEDEDEEEEEKNRFRSEKGSISNFQKNFFILITRKHIEFS
jgi:hypothetical protein